MTCVENCAACCFRFSLDWLPNEFKKLPKNVASHASARMIRINGEEFKIYSDLQEDNKDFFCRNLERSNARCQIHGVHPLSCDFELLRFKSGKKRNWFGHAPFGRGWKLKRIDEKYGVLCEWENSHCTDEWLQEIIRKLKRLQDWANYFQIETVIPNIIEWVSRGPHARGIVLNSRRKGFGLCQTMSQD
jgi:Fe-S-cluster containining protein